MFTGIIEALGILREARRERGGLSLSVDAVLPGEPLVLGESIAVSGPCLTVERVLPGGFTVFASSETVARTTLSRARAGLPVNCERALRVGGRLGGHFVSGHVDGVGRIRRVAPSGEAREITITAPDSVVPFLAPKGSIAVDGISLTVNEVRGADFTVMIIPHTLASTTLVDSGPGVDVNLEADVIARYVQIMATGRGGGVRGALSEEALRSLGWSGRE
jgi:riboflavin synthase